VNDTSNYVVNVTNTVPTIPTTGNTGSGAGSQPVLTSTPALSSSLVTTINHNGSAVYTSNAGDRSAYAQINATAGDTITVVTSSSNSADQANNTVKSTISVSEGNV
jgi:hypothetical protein